MRTKILLACCFVLAFASKSPAQIFTTPPPTPVRTMAEWEELQALVITWNDQNHQNKWISILTEIARAAREECRVLICCENQTMINSAKTFLTGRGVDISSNVEFVVAPNNSIWVRDYGPNTVYFNDVDSLAIIDWIYNRPTRPKDNAVPEKLGEYLQVPVFSTKTAPYDLVNTGGNFMSDGMGTAFASKLIFTNNDQIQNGECGTINDVLGTSTHTESSIDNIMQEFMGIDRYVKLDLLPYDCIHHIDMHIKLLDEQTLLVGKYPEGVADGPQIEANIQYILGNVSTIFGTPFNVVRIPMPPEGGQYPNASGDYRTYANAVFVNKSIIVPFYETQYDTVAQRIWQEAMPGYKIVGINCNDIIPSLGAIHCITHEIGVADPLRIVHKPLNDVVQNNMNPPNYPATALIQHRSGIASAKIFYRRRDSGWESVPMSAHNAPDSLDYWTGYIPRQEYYDTLFYFIEATANNGKTITRPLPGSEGPWRFRIHLDVSGTKTPALSLQEIYPNPASGITVLPVQAEARAAGKILLLNSLGQVVHEVFSGEFPAGVSNHFLDAATLPSGTYFVKLQTGTQVLVKKWVVRGK